MHDSLRFVTQKRMEKVAAALRKNRMEAYVAATKAEVVPLVEKLVPQGAVVANGGSVTLQECGVMEHLRSGRYDFIDREAPGITDMDEIYRRSFYADAYFCSANAVTETGEILEMDGRANRVAAIAYGPKSVIMVVSYTKIVGDLAAARARVAQVAAPANTHRLSCKTPCATTGICIDCESPGRICCTELILHMQREENRIKVILVGEEAGY